MSIESEACFITLTTKFIDDSIQNLVDDGVNISSALNQSSISQFVDNLINYLSEDEQFDII